jgi:hypothetical protein
VVGHRQAQIASAWFATAEVDTACRAGRAGIFDGVGDKLGAMNDLSRPERLQIMLTAEELAALDERRFQRRMPSGAAAVRELLKCGLAAERVVMAAGREVRGVRRHPFEG